MQRHVIAALCRRQLASYFASPAGYVFITVFVFLASFAAFWTPAFFTSNLATLDQLTRWFPWLLLFVVPAITMGAWAEERRAGTHELLATLPARDIELALGKLLAGVAIYTAALGFAALGQIAVLFYLGTPDIGLLFSSYLGQWLAGASLIAVGMAASAFTSNLTVAFILGAALCALVVGFGSLASLTSGLIPAPVAAAADFTARFGDFAKGVVDFDSAVYFLALGALGLWANTFLLARAHWAGSPGARPRTGLAFLRGGAVAAAALAFVVLTGRAGARLDTTAERLWSLSPETRSIVRGAPADRPVLITAYLSPNPPGVFAGMHETLLGLLDEIDDASGGSSIAVRVVETEPSTEEAREAQRNYNIAPRMVGASPGDLDQTPRPVFTGLVFTSGPDQAVVPFLTPGAPIEYVLARGVRTVTAGERKRVGVFKTDAEVFGGFDFTTFRPRPDWSIVAELRNQYEVVNIPATAPIAGDIDALVVVQPSTLTDEEMSVLLAYVRAGRPTLIFEDPFPIENPALATSEPRSAGANPFQPSQDPRAQTPKADLTPLWDALGVSVPATQIAFDYDNPHRELETNATPEWVFVQSGAGATGFDARSPVTSGLVEALLLWPGRVSETPGATGRNVTPLMRTGGKSGTVRYSDVATRDFFGGLRLNPNPPRLPSAAPQLLAVHVTGEIPPPTPPTTPTQGESADPAAAQAGATGSVNAILVADLDVISNQFFFLRDQGFESLNFDNVPFVLNAVDVLVGDDSLVELRKKRRAHRTLTRIDGRRTRLQEEMRLAIDEAEASASEELARAQSRLSERIAEIQGREDLDENTRQILAQSEQVAQQRSFNAASERIEDEKTLVIQEARDRASGEIKRIEAGIRFAAVLLPPIPAFALAVMVFVGRRSREREGVARERLVNA